MHNFDAFLVFALVVELCIFADFVQTKLWSSSSDCSDIAVLLYLACLAGWISLIVVIIPLSLLFLVPIYPIWGVSAEMMSCLAFRAKDIVCDWTYSWQGQWLMIRGRKRPVILHWHVLIMCLLTLCISWSVRLLIILLLFLSVYNSADSFFLNFVCFLLLLKCVFQNLNYFW